ncbi:MAG: class I tRNA ligase family protein [Ilumatobacteraceae bacterium]
MYRFLQRLWRNLVDESTGEISVDTPVTDELLRHLHRTIAGVTDDMANLRFNTAIAKLIELNNALTKAGGCPKELAEPLVVMVAPLAPHLAEELWAKLGHTSSVSGHPFPVADPAMLVTDEIELPVQVNGKVRGRITVAADAAADAVQATALADPRVRAALAGATPTKVIVVPGRMVNIVA